MRGDRASVGTVNGAGVRDAVISLLDDYAAAGGVGIDAFDDQPRVHAMAEAKYTLACLALHRAGVLGTGAARKRVTPSLERLAALAFRPVGVGRAWGLGFAYRGLPADEPYVITTAIVLDALHGARTVLDSRPRAEAEALRDDAVVWLLDGVPRVAVADAPFPRYSPGLDTAAMNVAASWAGALVDVLGPGHARHRELVAVAQAVRAAAVPGVGWTYEPGTNRVDLLHTCYTGYGLLRALPAAPGLAHEVLTALLQFGGVPGWTDVFDVLPVDDPATVGAVGRRPVRVVDGHLLAGFDKPARVWSLGEALVLLGELVRTPALAPLATHLLGTTAPYAVEAGQKVGEFRHTMHVAHGLAAYLAVLRRAPRGGA